MNLKIEIPVDYEEFVDSLCSGVIVGIQFDIQFALTANVVEMSSNADLARRLSNADSVRPWHAASAAKRSLTSDVTRAAMSESAIIDVNCETLAADLSAQFTHGLSARFPLPCSADVRLLALKNAQARAFYEAECLRSGWSVRQLDRQIQSQFYERMALSRNKAVMLAKAARSTPGDAISPDAEVKDPYVLEFLGLRDEYSQSDLEAALIQHLETFLLELGGDICFIGRQRRLRIGDEWYRVDLVFLHRRLRWQTRNSSRRISKKARHMLENRDAMRKKK